MNPYEQLQASDQKGANIFLGIILYWPTVQLIQSTVLW